MIGKYHISNYIDIKDYSTVRNESIIQLDLFYPNSVLNSFEYGDLITIAGRPCNGRTSLVISLLKDLAIEKQIPTAFFCLDWKRNDFINRLLANVVNIPYCKLKENKCLSDDDLIDIHEATTKLKSSPLHLDGFKPICIETLSSRIKEFVKEEGVKIIFITGFQTIKTSERFIDCRYAYSNIARTLKFLARELNITIIVTSCLNWFMEEREGIDGKHPQLADLREIGDLDEISDIVIGTFIPMSYHIYLDEKGRDLRNLLICDILKTKEGITDKRVVFYRNPDTFAITGISELEGE